MFTKSISFNQDQLGANSSAHKSALRTPPVFVAGKTILIVMSGLAAYLPAIHGDFILDDTLYVTNNRLNTQADGLQRIWFTLESRDYWPVTYSALWWQWREWGRNPTGYHVVNLVLHIVSALLVWSLLRKLAIPGAFLAALIFTVHPVNVESVAWISQLKGLLAVNFFLISLLAYARDDQRGAGRVQRNGGWKSNPSECSAIWRPESCAPFANAVVWAQLGGIFVGDAK